MVVMQSELSFYNGTALQAKKTTNKEWPHSILEKIMSWFYAKQEYIF